MEEKVNNRAKGVKTTKLLHNDLYALCLELQKYSILIGRFQHAIPVMYLKHLYRSDIKLLFYLLIHKLVLHVG